LQVVEPLRVKSGLLGVSVEEKTEYLLNVPIQIDFWIPFNRYTANRFVVSARGNANVNRSFLIFGVGYRAVFFEN